MPTIAGEIEQSAGGVAALDDALLRGGHRVVADASDMNALIGTDFAKAGMLVTVLTDGNVYKLNTAGDTFELLSTGGGGSGIVFARGNPALHGAGFVERFIDGDTGDDNNAGTSWGAAWATPRRAAEEVPDDYGRISGDAMLVQVRGTAQPGAIVDRYFNDANSGYVFFTPDISTPVLAEPTATFVAEGTRWRTQIATGLSAHGGFTPASHFLLRKAGDFYLGYPLQDSVSTELRVGSLIGGAVDVRVHTFQDLAASNFNLNALTLGCTNSTGRSKIYYCGFNFTGSGWMVLENAQFLGCKNNAGVVEVREGATWDGYFETGNIRVYGPNVKFRGILGAGVSNYNIYNGADVAVIAKSGVQIVFSGQISNSNQLYMSGCEFEGAGTNCVLVQNADLYVGVGPWIEDGTRARVFDINASRVRMNTSASSPNSPSITGEIARLRDGSQLYNAIAAFSPSITGGTPGSEIEIDGVGFKDKSEIHNDLTGGNFYS